MVERKATLAVNLIRNERKLRKVALAVVFVADRPFLMSPPVGSINPRCLVLVASDFFLLVVFRETTRTVTVLG